MSPESKSLRALFDRLRCFKVTRWTADSSNDDATPDRAESRVDKADVVSSQIKFSGNPSGGTHQVVLDIDHPAWLVKSTTPGHFHLYIDVPDGIEWAKYATMMVAMSEAGVLEEGYVKASMSRGYSAVRLPWVKKPRPSQRPPAEVTVFHPAPPPSQPLPSQVIVTGARTGRIQRLDPEGDHTPLVIEFGSNAVPDQTSRKGQSKRAKDWIELLEETFDPLYKPKPKPQIADPDPFDGWLDEL